MNIIKKIKAERRRKQFLGRKVNLSLKQKLDNLENKGFLDRANKG